MRYHSKSGHANQEQRRKTLEVNRRFNKEQVFLVEEAVRTVFERTDLPFELPSVKRFFGVHSVPLLSLSAFNNGFSRGFESRFNLNEVAEDIRYIGKNEMHVKIGRLAMVKEHPKCQPKTGSISVRSNQLRLEQQAVRDVLFAAGANGFANRRGNPLDPREIQLLETYEIVHTTPDSNTILTDYYFEEKPPAFIEDLDGEITASLQRFGVMTMTLMPAVVDIRKRRD